VRFSCITSSLGSQLLGLADYWARIGESSKPHSSPPPKKNSQKKRKKNNKRKKSKILIENTAG